MLKGRAQQVSSYPSRTSNQRAGGERTHTEAGVLTPQLIAGETWLLLALGQCLPPLNGPKHQLGWRSTGPDLPTCPSLSLSRFPGPKQAIAIPKVLTAVHT